MKKRELDHVLRVAGRITGEKQFIFTRALARRGILSEKRLLELLAQTSIDEPARTRIRHQITRDFRAGE